MFKHILIQSIFQSGVLIACFYYGPMLIPDEAEGPYNDAL